MSPALLYSLATLILSTSLAVACVVVSWRWASAAIRPRKPPPSELTTPTSGRLDRIEADQVELSSNLEKVLVTMKRLNSRAAVQDHRARQNGELSAPPRGTSKAELLRYYGMAGKVGPAFAQAQLDLEQSQRPN